MVFGYVQSVWSAGAWYIVPQNEITSALKTTNHRHLMFWLHPSDIYETAKSWWRVCIVAEEGVDEEGSNPPLKIYCDAFI
jgi:hypothetical protein